MNTEYLRYFIAACKYGSILEASRNLYITAQGMGAGIHRLEKSIGIKLIENHYNGVRPTEFGKMFYEEAVLACKAVDRLDELAREYRENQKEIVTVGVVGTSKFSHGIQSGITEFQKANPDIGVKGKLVIKKDGQELISDVREGNIDIGLFFHIKEEEEFCYHTISPYSRLMLLINAGHPLADKGAVRWTDIRELRYVAAAPQDPFINLLNAVCAGYGFAPETIFYSTENSQNARFIDQNICAMFVRECYADTILQFCKNTVLLPVQPEVSAACSWFCRKNDPFEGDRGLFRDSLQEYSRMVFSL